VCERTVRKWTTRAAEGDLALEDRSCRPHRSPRAISAGLLTGALGAARPGAEAGIISMLASAAGSVGLLIKHARELGFKGRFIYSPLLPTR
jgi:hypothetical protein